MSRDALMFLVLHLMAVTLFFVCIFGAGEGVRQIYSFLGGVMFWPVTGTARDLYKQIKTDLQLG